MPEVVAYTIISVLIVIVVSLLARRAPTALQAETESERDSIQDLSNELCLSLAERIFDPADCEWLRDELRFPELAENLARFRAMMALRWLRTLRLSFKELVRRPEAAATAAVNLGTTPADWRLLWLTLRFHFLLGYAILVVRLFGPYHRLVPPLGWFPSPPSNREPALGATPRGLSLVKHTWKARRVF